ncbi:hypothetical protein [Fromanvirus D29]|uniref:Uncharacterized protein n=1 Tax=Mycobacterium phage D29 TaxID=28369 RepID=A0A2Z5XCX4_BPMD2|nr:hypothetical protein [Fromanvirus D29]
MGWLSNADSFPINEGLKAPPKSRFRRLAKSAFRALLSNNRPNKGRGIDPATAGSSAAPEARLIEGVTQPCTALVRVRTGALNRGSSTFSTFG